MLDYILWGIWGGDYQQNFPTQCQYPQSYSQGGVGQDVKKSVKWYAAFRDPLEAVIENNGIYI